MSVRIVCREGHTVDEDPICPHCGGRLTLDGREKENQTVAVCDNCWKDPNNYERNITMRDIRSFLKIKKCPKCGSREFFFKKE